MVKAIMHGCCGHMGQVISELAASDPEIEIVAGIDIADKGNTSYPVYTDMIFLQQRQLMPFWSSVERKNFRLFFVLQVSAKSSFRK